MKRPFKGVHVDTHTSVWLQAIKAKTGLSEAEQIRRGIEMWLQAYDWTIVSDRSAGAATQAKEG
jgi:hypothetical protein